MATVKSQATLERAFRQSPQVQQGLHSVATELAVTARKLTYLRAYNSGRLARSWSIRKTSDGWIVQSSLRTALFQEGGTGKVYPRIAPYRVIVPVRARVLRFRPRTGRLAPTGRKATGRYVYTNHVRGWKPQHILRDSGRTMSKYSGLKWKESRARINHATMFSSY